MFIYNDTYPGRGAARSSWERPLTRDTMTVSTPRIFDSCAGRECLEDLQLFFNKRSQEVIAQSNSVSGVSAQVSDAAFKVEKSSVSRGCFCIDSTFYFEVELLAYPCDGGDPVRIIGKAHHKNSSVLRGPDSSVRTFTSAGQVNPAACTPQVTAQVSELVLLSTKLLPAPPFAQEALPCDVSDYYKNTDLAMPQSGDNVVLCTLGMFCVLFTERPVQIVVPVRGYAIPEKKCEDPEQNSCDIFKEIHFPVKDFFPPDRG